jgi:hypothetical protein
MNTLAKRVTSLLFRPFATEVAVSLCSAKAFFPHLFVTLGRANSKRLTKQRNLLSLSIFKNAFFVRKEVLLVFPCDQQGNAALLIL